MKVAVIPRDQAVIPCDQAVIPRLDRGTQSVMPAQAGIQVFSGFLDTSLRWYDIFRDALKVFLIFAMYNTPP